MLTIRAVMQFPSPLQPERTACAALQGQDYKREVPESAARAIRRGAA
jgi:hypothetical protein